MLLALIIKRGFLIHHSFIFSWPALLPEPWTSLEELHLQGWLVDDPDMFKDVDLHMSFPNLTLLNMRVSCGRFLLPDMSGCERLESVTLQSKKPDIRLFLSFQCNLEEKVTEINYI